ncbi:3017_t:CDS:2, partial [Entrophospora sp. SA101]
FRCEYDLQNHGDGETKKKYYTENIAYWPFDIEQGRPHRFGKSTYLCLYYDVHDVNDFDQLFGPLYIGKYPTPSHNTHLVLRFDLSTIDTDSYEEMQVAFNDQLNRNLCEFIKKYEVELDEYDTPGNNSAFRMEVRFLNDIECREVSRIEQFFTTNFFAPLKKGCSHAIDKLYVTGVTPIFHAGLSPLLILDDISNQPEFHGICGSTENEVKAISLYYFDNNEQLANDAVDQIKRKSIGFVSTPSELTAVNSTRILTYIAEQSPVSINNLFDILIHGSVQISHQNNFNYSDLFNTGEENIMFQQQRLVWSLLYYFGILTHVSDCISAKKDIGCQRFQAYTSLIQGNIDHLAKGKVRNYSDSGIVDSRVGTKKDPSQLRGYLILTIGSCRVIVWSSNSMIID